MTSGIDGQTDGQNYNSKYRVLHEVMRCIPFVNAFSHNNGAR